MKTTKTFFAMVICFLYSLSYSQTAPVFEWAKQMGGTGSDNGIAWSITSDNAGNVYTTGSFGGTIDFDPGAGIYNLTSVDPNDIFISKLDSFGNFMWAKKIGGGYFDVGEGITIDALGNVYTTGYFHGTVDFDPGIGVYNMISQNTDAFILKLDASGNFMWAKDFACSLSCISQSIITDVSGNVYTTGSFGGTVDFDPGVATFNITSLGGNDVFVSKLDASGNFVWAKQIGGTLDQVSLSIAIDASSNTFIVGNFFGTVDFDPGASIFNLTSAGSDDNFILKLDVSGNLIWVKQIGSADSDEGLSIALDVSGNVFTTGGYLGTVDFDPGAGSYYLTSQYFDCFISKLDASGNFVWAKNIGNHYGIYNTESGIDITCDNSGNVFIGGLFEGTVDFDPGIDTFNLISAGERDNFILKLDTKGNYGWAVRFGNSKSDFGVRSLRVENNGDIYSCGLFSGTVDFDPGTDKSKLTATGESDIFIQKLKQSLVCSIPKGLFSDEITNNSAKIHWDYVGTANKYKVQYRVTGTDVWSKTSSSNNYKKLNTLLSSTEYDWELKSVCSDLGLDNSKWSAIQNFTTLPARFEAEFETPSFEVYPNPFSASTTISFILENNSHSSIELFDLTGRKIKTLLDENLEAGAHEVQLSREQFFSGIYFLQLKINDQVIIKKLVIE